MKKVSLIFSAALAGIIVFQWLFYKCESDKKDRIMEDKDRQIAACANAPTVIDSVEAPIYLWDTIYLPSKFTIKRTVTGSEAVDWTNRTIQQRQYTGVYTHPQFQLHWAADVTGTLDRMTINPPSLIKSLIITKEKTVNLTQYITEKPKERSHLYATFGVGMLGKEFGSADVGLMYIRKEGWGLQAGIGTDFEQLAYQAGMVIRLK